MDELPVPPFDLRQRVGAVVVEDPGAMAQLRTAPWWDEDPLTAWLNQGRMLADFLVETDPDPMAEARVLDFGCGAGRVLRHLVGRAAELHGAELDEPSVDWLRDHLGDHVQAVLTTEEPGLPYPDDHFDVAYAYSVFTHLTVHWAGWLAELHRVLRPGGVLLASTISPRTAAEFHIPVLPDDTPGVYMVGFGNPWDAGGPVTIHHREWVAEHWGRAFDILEHRDRALPPPWPHDWVVARARPGVVSPDQLLAPGSDAQTEGRARRVQVGLVRADAAGRRGWQVSQGSAVAHEANLARAALAPEVAARAAALAEEAEQLRGERRALRRARRLQVTRPLRSLSGRRW